MKPWLILSLTVATHVAAGPEPVSFEVKGNRAFVCTAPKPAEGRPWVWYAPILRGLSFAERSGYFEAFLKAGISIAGYDQGEVRGAPASTARFNAFYDAMVKRGFSPKPVLLGQSRGGMMTLAWAFRHPEKVTAWVGIYPVCNLASWPLIRSEKQTLLDFGLTKEAFLAQLKDFNPMDNLAGLAARRVPMFAVHGDSDVVVPYELNTKMLHDRYTALGGQIEVRVIPGEGHKVGPSFFECQELIDFVLKHAKTSVP